jgi:hypothetical protein
VLPALALLLPGGGLVKGSVVAVEQPGALCLALMAGASQAGMWCGVAGLPGLGVLAAAGAGVEPGRAHVFNGARTSITDLSPVSSPLGSR